MLFHYHPGKSKTKTPSNLKYNRNCQWTLVAMFGITIRIGNLYCFFKMRENHIWKPIVLSLNTLRPREMTDNFPDGAFKCIFLNENVWISINISLNFVQGPINNIPALVQIMTRRRPVANPSSEPMMVNLLMHIYVTPPQLVNCHNKMPTL